MLVSENLIQLPLSILALRQSGESPNDIIERLFPYAERKDFRKYSLMRSVIHSSGETISVYSVDLDVYLKAVEALDYAQSVIKEFIEAFEQVKPKENQ